MQLTAYVNRFIVQVCSKVTRPPDWQVVEELQSVVRLMRWCAHWVEQRQRA